jgi:aquaporin related protein
MRLLDFVAMIGEYVGTTLFMIFALGGTKWVDRTDDSSTVLTDPLASVANIPNTNVTNATHAGQDGSTASAANTSNLYVLC